MAYYTNCGPRSGMLRYAVAPETAGVLTARNRRDPIVRATCVGRNLGGLAVWRIVVGESEVPGLWIVVDQAFCPA
jgi:hypothetical protein